VRAREVFGDFEVPSSARMADLCSFYGWPAVADPNQTAADWLADALGRPPVEGDHANLGAAELSVRQIEDGEITRVGIRLLHQNAAEAANDDPA